MTARTESRIQKIVALFEQYKPKSFEQVEGLGIKITEIDRSSGAFRDTFRVKGLPIVIKIPRGAENDSKGFPSNIAHSNEEMKAYRKIMRVKKYEKLRDYMPEIYYHNRNTGVIVMKRYERLKYRNKYHIALSDLLDKLSMAVWSDDELDIGCLDIGCANCGMESYGDYFKLVVLDLGLFFNKY